MEERRYNSVEEMPDWAKPTIIRLIDCGVLTGIGELTGSGPSPKDADGRPADLDLAMWMIRFFVINDRAGLYG